MGGQASPRPEDSGIESTWGESAQGGSQTVLHGAAVNADLKRLICLLTNEDTTELHERQLGVLRRVCKVRQKGFRYGELPLVEKLLPLVASRVTSGRASEFRAPLLKVLDICSLPPVRDRANEEFTVRGLTASSSLFRVLGGTLWSPDAIIQAATADVLRKIASGNDPTRPSTPDDEQKYTFGVCRNDLRPKPKDINQALLLGCGVVASAVDCLGAVMGSVLESLAEIDDSSFPSSSFEGNEGDEGVQAESDEIASGEQPLAEQDTTRASGDDLALEEAEGTAAVNCQAEIQLVEDDDRGAASDVSMKCAVLISVLQFVRELSTDEASSVAMVEAGLMSLLVQVMRGVRGVRDPTLSITVEVMWNCLEHSQNAMTTGPSAENRMALIRKARKGNAAFALSTWDGVSTLRDAMEALLIGGFRNKDKELRNEAIIVASQLASNSRSHPLFRTTGMLLLLLRYATAIETGLADGDLQAAESEARTFALAVDEFSNGGSGGERREIPELGALADRRNFATMTEVDMEFKLLLWSLLADLCKRDARNLEVVRASPLMETLLMYMDLVVEEGACTDAPPTGRSRSVSLASMPSVGTAQIISAAFGKEDSTTVEGKHAAREPSAYSDPGKCVPQASSRPLKKGSISQGEVNAGSDLGGKESHGTEMPLPENTVGVGSNATERDASMAATEQLHAEPAVGQTQLYVPATVVRLPVTSIQLLQGQAMASLLVLAPKFSRKFQALGGHMVTLRLLERLGSRPENRGLVKMATKMLATVVGLPGLKEELGRVDGVRIMLERFSDAGENEPHGGGAGGGGGGGGGAGSGADGGSNGGKGGDDLCTDTVIILCRLCEECPENQEAFRKADGVPAMMAAIKAYCQARSEARQHEGGNEAGRAGSSMGGESGGSPSVELGGDARESGNSNGETLDASLVHIVDCVWCAVVGNRRSEARLLQCEGLDTLLDLLELCPVFMRHQVTGVVADLLRNRRSIPYARAWRSDLNMLSITQLMVRLWIAEEARLGVSRPNGVLQNLWQPLQSHACGVDRRSRNSERIRRTTSRQVSVGRPDRDCATTLAESTSLDVQLSRAHASSAGNDARGCASETRPSETTADTPPNGTPPESAEGVAGLVQVREGQEYRAPPSAIALALQAGKRAASMGQRAGGGRVKAISIMGAEASVAKAMMHLDLRGKIAAVLGMVGFDGASSDGLGPSDLKASFMATSYLDFRAGEAWQEVAAELETQQVNPIAVDALVLDTMLERAFDCAQEVKSRQMALSVEQGQREGKTEEAFFAGILFQRDQEIRQAIIKRNALMPGTSRKRLAAKKAKENMIKRSGGRSSEGSSDLEIGLGQGLPEEDREDERDADTGDNRVVTAAAG